MIRTVEPLRDLEGGLKQRPRLVGPPLALVEDSELAEHRRHTRLNRAARPLLDLEGAPVERLGGCVRALTLVHSPQLGQRVGELRRVEAESLLLDRERLLEVALRLIVSPQSIRRPPCGEQELGVLRLELERRLELPQCRLEVPPTLGDHPALIGLPRRRRHGLGLSTFQLCQTRARRWLSRRSYGREGSFPARPIGAGPRRLQGRLQRRPGRRRPGVRWRQPVGLQWPGRGTGLYCAPDRDSGDSEQRNVDREARARRCRAASSRAVTDARSVGGHIASPQLQGGPQDRIRG
jgi:hypothetical protein